MEEAIQQSIEQLANCLLLKQMKLVTAESCTGGLLAAYCTHIAGSSDWFERGFVTYSNAAKQQCLAVSNATLRDFGAVSEPTAIAMAEGALQHSEAQVALSTTGIAGPSGGNLQKPIGMVCFAWAITGQATQVQTQYFRGARASIRNQAVLFSFEKLLEVLT